MKKIRDRFSGHSAVYQKYRPQYPAELYDYILSQTTGRERCWDCATGNGQVAQVLAGHFKKVDATDVSANQLAHAPNIENVTYGVQRAENTSFKPGSFDLITVAQAVHWFDIAAFVREVQRVSRPGAVLAVWGYGLLRLGRPFDEKIARFYEEVVGPYWDGERKHIDSAYATIPLPLKTPKDLCGFEIRYDMDFNTLSGYLTSWSSVQNYIQKHGQNPVAELMAELKPSWPGDQACQAVFPLFGKMGTVERQTD